MKGFFLFIFFPLVEISSINIKDEYFKKGNVFICEGNVCNREKCKEDK